MCSIALTRHALHGLLRRRRIVLRHAASVGVAIVLPTLAPAASGADLAPGAVRNWADVLSQTRHAAAVDGRSLVPRERAAESGAALPPTDVDPASAPAPATGSRAVRSSDRAAGAAPLDISPSTLRRAIDDAKDPLDDVALSPGGGFGTAGARQERIDQSFRDADIPSCMTPEAFRFEPPRIGPFAFGGLLAAPFLLHAIVTGKCRN